MSAGQKTPGNEPPEVHDPGEAIFHAALHQHFPLPPKPLHSALDATTRMWNEKMTFRLVGHDSDGKRQGKFHLRRDLTAIEKMEAAVYEEPLQLQSQLRRYRDAMKKVDGDLLKLSPEVFRFVHAGGHITSHSVRELNDFMNREDTYMVLAEQHTNGHAVPVGYNYGFISMPVTKKYPNLDARNVAPDSLEKDRHHFWTIWRATVVDLRRSLVDVFRQHHVPVPKQLEGMPMRRRGINNAFKVVLGTTAQDLHKKWMTFNTARVVDPADIVSGSVDIGQAMTNMAIRKANEGVFLPSALRRTYANNLRQDHREVARVYWEMFFNTTQSVLNAEKSPQGVLQQKGGWCISQLESFGHIIANVLKQRSFVQKMFYEMGVEE